MSSEVSKGILKSVFLADKDEAKRKYPKLKLQLLKFKSVTEGDRPKLRFTLSDGEYLIQGVQSDDKANVKNIAQPELLSIIELSHYEPFLMGNTRPVVLVWDWSVASPPCEKIGEPTALSDIRKLTEGSTGEETKTAGNGNSSNATSAPAPKPASNGPTSGSKLPQDLKKKLGGKIIPVEQVSPYTNAWALRVRVSAKSDIRTYRNSRGDGKLFNVTFIDESGEIRATGFNDRCDAFYEKLQEDKVYYISKFQVTMANKKFSNVQNDYELMFEKDSVVEECPSDEAIDLPKVQYNFTQLKSLTDIDNNGSADVVGVLKEVGESNEMTSKAGRTFEKRDIVLVDRSDVEVNCALWGKTAQDFKGTPGSVLALKGARVSDFGGRSLSVGSNTAMHVDPDIPEAHELKGWYDSEGQNKQFGSLKGEVSTNTRNNEPALPISEVKAKNYGMSDTPDYFNMLGTVTYVGNKTLMYPACNSAQSQGTCMKKAIEETDGQWRCEKCNATFDRPHYRFVLNGNVGDATGDIWVSFFNESGEKILGGKTANEIHQLQEEGEDDEVSNILASTIGKEFQFRMQAKLDTFQEQSGVRYQCMAVQPVDFAAATRSMLDDIEKY